eukprot:scaffold58913_cov56-Phaeocystis_antarctica.AAC.1
MVPLPPRPVLTASVRASTSDTERSLYSHSLLRCHQLWHSGSRSSMNHRGSHLSQYDRIAAVQSSLSHAHAAGAPTIAHPGAAHGLPTPGPNEQLEASCMRRRASCFSLQGSMPQLFDEMSLTSSPYVSTVAWSSFVAPYIGHPASAAPGAIPAEQSVLAAPRAMAAHAVP